MASLGIRRSYGGLRQTTRLLVNKTTSGATLRFAGFTELWIYGITELGLRCATPDKGHETND